MSRYVIFGGFLGAGKTTLMMALSDRMEARGRKASILVNDLGNRDLVDARFTEAMGYAAHMIHGGCICWLHEELIEHLRQMRDEEKAELILSDIPGCGIGALEHVYHTLARDYAGEVVLSPFTAVVDPLRLQRLLPDVQDIHLPEELDYIFDAQMKEAEIIVLNKTDLLSREECVSMLGFLKERYPHAVVFGISAKLRTGLDELLDWILTHESLLPLPDLGTDTPAFAAAESWLSWYDCQFHLQVEDAIDGNDLVTAMMEAIRGALMAVGRNVPHLKIMGESDKDEIVKMSLIGVDQPLSKDRMVQTNCTEMNLYINARAACEAEQLTQLCDVAISETLKAFGCTRVDLYSECINMMDE